MVDRRSPVTFTLAALRTLVALGESDTLEFKRSTANLRRAGETLCGMLNGAGGSVLIGVADGGALVGHSVSDQTMQEVAGVLRAIEPAAPVRLVRLAIEGGRVVPEVVLTERQEAVLKVLLETGGQLPFRVVISALHGVANERTVRRDLVRLRELGLVEAGGRGRGATWRAVRRNRDIE
jgi:hypothetical protein